MAEQSPGYDLTRQQASTIKTEARFQLARELAVLFNTLGQHEAAQRVLAYVRAKQ